MSSARNIAENDFEPAEIISGLFLGTIVTALRWDILNQKKIGYIISIMTDFVGIFERVLVFRKE